LLLPDVFCKHSGRSARIAAFGYHLSLRPISISRAWFTSCSFYGRAFAGHGLFLGRSGLSIRRDGRDRPRAIIHLNDARKIHSEVGYFLCRYSNLISLVIPRLPLISLEGE
jgi:hypothetical protein